MSMSRRLALLAALLPVLLALPGCGSKTRLDALRDRLDAARRDRTEDVAALEDRVRTLEFSSHRMHGYAHALGAGTRVAVAAPGEGRAPAAPRAGAGDAAAARRGNYGGVLRQALGVDPPNLDPAKLTDTTSYRVAKQVLEGLVELDDDLEVAPLLAESWEISEDLTSYTFRLKPGVRFHNGREVTAEDFVYTFTRILEPRTASVRVWILDRIRGYQTFASFRRLGDAVRQAAKGEDLDLAALRPHRDRLAALTRGRLEELGHPAPRDLLGLAKRLVTWLDSRGEAAGLDDAVSALAVSDFLAASLEAVDRHTLRIRLDAPFAPFLQLLTMVQVSVVPREDVERLGDDFAFRPVGTGAFRFASWEHDVKVELEAFDDYHGGRPYLDRLEFRIIPDPVTQLTEFAVRNLEVLTRIADEKYEVVKADPGFEGDLLEEPTLHIFYLGMNPARPPFTDVRVRRAFNHAIDKRAILEKIRKGRGVIAKGPLPPMVPSYDPGLAGYDFDPAKAKALLAEAGFDPPSKLGPVEFWFNSSTGNDVNAKIAEVFQENLRRIGVTLELNSVDWGTYLDKAKRCEPPIYRLAWIGSYPDADGFLYALLHSSSVGQTNMSCYENPAFDRLLEAARETHDRAERTRLYREAQRLVVEDATWIPLFHDRAILVKKPWVRGVSLSARGPDSVLYRDVWLAEAPGE